MKGKKKKKEIFFSLCPKYKAHHGYEEAGHLLKM